MHLSKEQCTHANHIIGCNNNVLDTSYQLQALWLFISSLVCRHSAGTTSALDSQLNSLFNLQTSNERTDG